MWDYILFEKDDDINWYFVTFEIDNTVFDSYMWLNTDGTWTQSHTYSTN